MSRGPDIGTALARAIDQQAVAGGCTVTIERADWQRWSSATFTGARHQLTIGATPSPALNRWLEGLDEAQFSIRDHLVADLLVVAVRRAEDRVEADLEILTVEAR